jgi:Zn-dependent protease
MDDWVPIVEAVVVIVYSVSLHELAHALVATWCGDPTPGRHGRLTWNPLVQLHPVYSILMPIIGYALARFPFGFAYTPIDPSRFRRPLRDRALVSLAGPVANFLFMFLFIGLLWIPAIARPPIGDRPAMTNFYFFSLVAFYSLLLGTFNLLPLPGLDGYSVIRPLLPLALRRSLDDVARMGFVPFVLILVLGSTLMGPVYKYLLLLFQRMTPGGAAEYVYRTWVS